MRDATQSSPTPRSRLLRKYLLTFVALVGGALLTSGSLEMWFSYQESKEALAQIQKEKALGAAARVELFVEEVTRQIGLTTRARWTTETLEQRRLDYQQLLRQAPAITEIAHLDASGREQLRVSRVAMDQIGSGADLSADPSFIGAKARKTAFSPVYFKKESEPYMTVAVAGTGRDTGVTMAEVNLKFILEVISRIKVGKGGYTYVVGARGFLITHPDIGLVLRKTDLSSLPQVRAVLDPTTEPDEVDLVGTSPSGLRVLTAHATIAPLGWTVFVDLPLEEAFEPIYASLRRTAALMLLGLVLAAAAGIVVARRIILPIRALQAGAERLGAGDLHHRITVSTGDELQELSERFNDMAGQLRDSYALLESKVEARTRELSESLEYQTAIAEVLAVISKSPSDLLPVLEVIIATSARLCRADIAHVTRPDENGDWHTVVSHGYAHGRAAALSADTVALGRSALTGRIVLEHRTVQIEDVLNDPDYDVRWSEKLGGYRTHLGVPLLRDGKLLGVLALSRTKVGPFDPKQIKLVETFADQAVIAIENARLVQELRAQTEALVASVDELKALGETGQAIVATLNLSVVLETLTPRAVEIAKADAGIVFRYVREDDEFRVWRAGGLTEATLAEVRAIRIRRSETSMGHAVTERRILAINDLQEAPRFALRDAIVHAGFLRVLIVPLVRGNRVFGALALLYRAGNAIPDRASDIMQAFASQSVVAIQNARLFREIEEKSRQLEIASQHKSQFLANMSHELRTPLNAILGYSELLADGLYGPLNEKQQGVLERVQSNGRHLLGLINDVLDLSKIEAGQFQLSVESYALGSVVRSVVAATESLAAAKGLELATVLDEGMPVGRGDERRLTQVLLNLVGNAIKFTDQGRVEIRARGEDGRFIIDVSDTGPGISAEDQAKIFEEFQQVDNTSTRQKGGTGLGLAISRRIVEMHGGHLNVSSTLGQGSVFRVDLPADVEAREAA